jgi:multiple sugar transport system permease protein
MKSRRKQKCTKVVLFVIAFFFATSFLMPIVLTVANSFMQESEISANYGAVFDSYTDDSNNNYYGNQQQTKSSYTSEAANLKFIPDMVTFKQYYTVLLQPGLFAEILEFGHFGCTDRCVSDLYRIGSGV